MQCLFDNLDAVQQLKNGEDNGASIYQYCYSWKLESRCEIKEIQM